MTKPENPNLRGILLMVAAMGGFASFWGLVRWRSRQGAEDPARQPVVVRAERASDLQTVEIR